MPAALRSVTVTLLSILLTACSINGSYPDATAPEAAKLRFVASTDSATLDYFDATHCAGLTTGILNNLFLADTKRRADMIVPPPANARGYLEIKLKPDQEVYFRSNTQGMSTVCATAFNLTPQAGSEYELSFNERPGFCTASLVRLQRVDGKDLRLPYPMLNKSVPACMGSNPLFPKSEPALPDTPQRTALIDRIIRDTITPDMQPNPAKASGTPLPKEKLDEIVAIRKQKIGIALSDDYWTQYRKNLVAFELDTARSKADSLQRYKAENEKYLRTVNDSQLEQWVNHKDDATFVHRSSAYQRARVMALYYIQVLAQIKAESLDRYLHAMAQLDHQYAVCQHYAGCWKQ